MVKPVSQVGVIQVVSLTERRVYPKEEIDELAEDEVDAQAVILYSGPKPGPSTNAQGSSSNMRVSEF